MLYKVVAVAKLCINTAGGYRSTSLVCVLDLLVHVCAHVY